MSLSLLRKSAEEGDTRSGHYVLEGQAEYKGTVSTSNGTMLLAPLAGIVLAVIVWHMCSTKDMIPRSFAQLWVC